MRDKGVSLAYIVRDVAHRLVVSMHSKHLIFNLLFLALPMFASTKVLADHNVPKNYIFWPVNLQDAHEEVCEPPLPSFQKTLCRTVSSGPVKLNYFEISSGIGLVNLIHNGALEHSEVSDGHIFFYERLTGDMVDDAVSVRRIFCISTQSGNIGYAWDGRSYQYHEEATETCPIGQEDWPWAH